MERNFVGSALIISPAKTKCDHGEIGNNLRKT